jgi:UDP-N-acetyl-D-glucosamine dehydrogenase
MAESSQREAFDVSRNYSNRRAEDKKMPQEREWVCVKVVPVVGRGHYTILDSGSAAQAVGRAGALSRLARSIDQRTARCAVVGLGYIGRSAMRSLLLAGFDVSGYDRSPQAVLRARAAGLEEAGERWSVGADPGVLADADVIVVTARVLFGKDGDLDLEPVASALRMVHDRCRDECLILLESTVPPGTTRMLADGLFARDDWPGIFIAHCPERLQSGGSRWTLRNTPHLVGGVDADATQLASRFWSTICGEVVAVSAPEVCELSKLLENSFMAVGIGLIGEITRMAHAFGLSAREVTAAAATKPFGYYPFHPGPGIGGHCIGNDLQILRRSFQDRLEASPILEAAAETAATLPIIVVDRLERLLIARDRHLAGARVLLVGVGFKPGSADTTNTPGAAIVRELRQRRARPSFVDSQVAALAVDGAELDRVDVDDLKQSRFDAGLILAGDPSVEAPTLERAVAVLLDAGGGAIMSGEFASANRL